MTAALTEMAARLEVAAVAVRAVVDAARPADAIEALDAEYAKTRLRAKLAAALAGQDFAAPGAGR